MKHRRSLPEYLELLSRFVKIREEEHGAVHTYRTYGSRNLFIVVIKETGFRKEERSPDRHRHEHS